MGMREEIEALTRYCTTPCQWGLIEASPEGRFLERSDVLRIIDRYAAPVVDMTPGMQPGKAREFTGCHAGTDGDCYWSKCPQTKDGEPHKSGRNCPLWTKSDDS